MGSLHLASGVEFVEANVRQYLDQLTSSISSYQALCSVLHMTAQPQRALRSVEGEAYRDILVTPMAQTGPR